MRRCKIFDLSWIRVFVSLLVFFVFTASQRKDDAIDMQNCIDMDVSFSVVKGMNESDNSILIDFNNMNTDNLVVSLVGPKQFYLSNLKEKEIKDLQRGVYSLVIVGKEETLNYCPKHFQVVIK